MKSLTLQVMEQTLIEFADTLLKVIELADSIADEVKALTQRVQALENE
jgi:hypothetical protein